MKSTKLSVEINFKLNLFYHLEKLSGSVPQRFNQKYATEFSNFEKLSKEFGWEFDPQNISWYFKKAIGKKKRLKKCMSEFEKRVERILLKSSRLYKPLWKKEIEPKLKNFSKKIDKNFVLDTLNKIETFTNLPFPREIKIYLIEALSFEYKFGAEPVPPNGIAIGRTNDNKLLKLAITHELVHLNLMNRIIKQIPKKYRKDESKINEAITDIITFRVLNIPLPKKTRNPYVKLFQAHLEDVKSIGNWKKFIGKILSEKE
ncbi:MAG: hypothetical protein QW140_00255 [Candidatus Aenigmatarchaeota archaeon]